MSNKNDFTNATQLNISLNEKNATMINHSSGEGMILPEGYVLNGKYIVTERLNLSSGEADLCLCTCKRKKYVAKV